MSRTLVLFLVGIVCLSGCVAIYIEPTTTERSARLRVAQINKAGQTSIQELSGACKPTSAYGDMRKIAMLDGHYTQIHPHLRKSLGMPDAPKDGGDFTEFRIPADKPFYLGVTRSESNVGGMLGTVETYCDVAISFMPESGVDYELMSGRRPGGCFLSLTKLTSDDGRVLRTAEPTTRLTTPCK